MAGDGLCRAGDCVTNETCFGSSPDGRRTATRFVVLPRRWRVERTLGWIMNARRNARDYERLPQHSEAHLNWALITLMARRLTRKKPVSDWTKKRTPTG
ncbi:hypothetical protein ADL12_38250 [Streptomyces regalis]|uniref:Transposase DDE domain-containing protein n=1 Tax=Streptomyces regalis TaxID=68262 RepID=A0A117MLJ0_9ACTN|nr:hypothetical protein ADL12_38250 [Streptomyces regalis]